MSDRLLDKPYDTSSNLNWITCGQSGDRILTLESLWIIENGEGPYPDGPYAQLYADVYRLDDDGSHGLEDADRFSSEAWDLSLGKNLKHVRGPQNGSCPKLVEEDWGFECYGQRPVDGWADRDLMHFRQAGLYRWGTGDWESDGYEARKRVLLLLFEESGVSDRDILGLETIHSDWSDDPCGVWVPLRRFSKPGAYVPAAPTGSISGFARIRTITVGSSGLDPWNCASAVPVKARVTVSAHTAAQGASVSFRLTFPWSGTQRTQIPTDASGSVLGDAARLGPSLASSGTVTLTTKRITSPLAVRAELSPKSASVDSLSLAAGQALAVFEFDVHSGKPYASWFKIEQPTLHSPAGSASLQLDVEVQRLCYKCSIPSPGPSTGYRCPAMSGTPTPCP